jgi:hypothetical protein
MIQIRKIAVAAMLLAGLATGTSAQPLSVPQNYGIRTMSFDLWCQQTQRYSADRCMQRRPEDVKAFEDYRAVIERYELDYQKQIQRERDTQTFTTRDPSQTLLDKQDGLGGGFGAGPNR